MSVCILGAKYCPLDFHKDFRFEIQVNFIDKSWLSFFRTALTRASNLHQQLTEHPVHIISPRPSLAISTPIGSSILSVSHVSSWTCSTPSLMLNSKSSVTKPHSNCSTFLQGVRSSTVISPHYWVTTVYSWDSSPTCVLEASK